MKMEGSQQTTQKYKINDPIKIWAKELNRISPKKTYRWLTSTWKDAQHHSLLEKCKSNPQ